MHVTVVLVVTLLSTANNNVGMAGIVAHPADPLWPTPSRRTVDAT